MVEKQYKYDVAFSFLAEDEMLVLQLNNLVKGRLNTFVYSEKQDILAGSDGEKTFSEVFGSEARIVVVFYREKWGSTKWTRVEEIAIRNRAYEEGYDFTLFIPLDQNPSVPKWLPKTRLWYGMERWGLEGAAGVIESKVQEVGGFIKEETALDVATLVAQEIAFEKRRKDFINSEKGVKASDYETGKLFDSICNIAENISKKSDDTKCQVIRKGDHLVIYSQGIALEIYWFNRYCNSLSDSELFVRILLGFPKLPGYTVFEEPIRLKELKFYFDIDQLDNFIWIDKNTSSVLSTQNFADYCMKLFFDEISKKVKKKISKR